MARKNTHAVALGRRGGSRNTVAQQRARAINGQSGGRPSLYRLIDLDHVNGHFFGTLQRRDGDSWITLEPPYDDAARAFLRRHR